jgi:hypothetical protein
LASYFVSAGQVIATDAAVAFLQASIPPFRNTLRVLNQIFNAIFKNLRNLIGGTHIANVLGRTGSCFLHIGGFMRSLYRDDFAGLGADCSRALRIQGALRTLGTPHVLGTRISSAFCLPVSFAFRLSVSPSAGQLRLAGNPARLTTPTPRPTMREQSISTLEVYA